MTSYREAGVDLDGAAEHVSAIEDLVTSTWPDSVVGSFGGFSAGIEMPAGFSNPVMMMSTDGVGTKLEIARISGKWDGVGRDLVAMCVDDLAAAGAKPIAFVDYMAVGSLRPSRDKAIVESIAEGCRLSGAALLGGETAEHPGVMGDDAVDLAGAALGIVEKGAQLDPNSVSPGDLIVGLSSPNARSNGFSLIRALFAGELADNADLFLDPSVIYAPTVYEACASGVVKAAAHITGGGLGENISRALPHGCGADVDTGTWDVPEVFHLISERGVSSEDMFRTFNMGIGFALIIAPEAVQEVSEFVRNHHPRVIGEVVAGSGVTLK